MAMGIVSDLEFEKELERNTPIKSTKITIEKPKGKGRGDGNVEVPNGLRKLIGDTSISESRSDALDLANHFGISPSSVSAYSNGSTSTTTYDKHPNGDVINKAKERISTRARNKLNLALKQITEEKLAVAKLKDVSGVAKDMSAIIRNMEPTIKEEKEDNEKGKGPTFIFYSPNIKQESDYEAITIKE